MESKKSPEANIENKRVPLIITGILFATALVLVAFEWKTFETEVRQLGDLELDLIEEEIIPISQQQPPPPPPSPPRSARCPWPRYVARTGFASNHQATT